MATYQITEPKAEEGIPMADMPFGTYGIIVWASECVAAGASSIGMPVIMRGEHCVRIHDGDWWSSDTFKYFRVRLLPKGTVISITV